MAVKKESIQQTIAGVWTAAGSVTVLLDRIGLVARYEAAFQLTSGAPTTMLGANQPDALWRPFRSLSWQAGGFTYMTMPDEEGGHGGTLLHHLNRLDGFGSGYVHQLVAAPSQVPYVPRLVFHAGVRPWKRNGDPNPFDLTAFIPAGIESSPQMVWLTTSNAVMDDTITIGSGTMFITAHRILGTTADIMEEMAKQGVNQIIEMIRQGHEGILPDADITGLVPSWTGQVESPAATASNYGSEQDMQLGGFIKRVTYLAQDATGTRPVRADDEITQLRLTIPEKGVTIVQMDAEQLSVRLAPGSFLVADEGLGLGVQAAPGGIYPLDLRPYGPTDVEQVLGLDTRGRQTGYAKLGRTLLTNTSGDDLLNLTERILTYNGRLSNS